MSRVSSKTSQYLRDDVLLINKKSSKLILYFRLITTILLPTIFNFSVLIISISNYSKSINEIDLYKFKLDSTNSNLVLLSSLLKEKLFLGTNSIVAGNIDGEIMYNKQLQISNNLLQINNDIYINNISNQTRNLTDFDNIFQRIIDLQDFSNFTFSWEIKNGFRKLLLVTLYIIEFTNYYISLLNNFNTQCVQSIDNQKLIAGSRLKEINDSLKQLNYQINVDNITRYLNSDFTMKIYYPILIENITLYCIKNMSGTVFIFTNFFEEFQTFSNLIIFNTVSNTQYLILNQRNAQVLWLMSMTILFVFVVCFCISGTYWFQRKIRNTLSVINELINEIIIRKQHQEVEKKKSETLLYSMIPVEAANQLRQRKPVKPKLFKSCSILFTEISNFDFFTSVLPPTDIVKFLNLVFNVFDDEVEIHDIYKVETVSSVYMISSGVPLPNEEKHVVETAEFALNIQKKIKDIKFTLFSEIEVLLKTGIHTGNVVTGIIGNLMPRYCLFGDTVNTASRMKTYCQERRIHVSKAFADLLIKFDLFQLEYRGIIEVKGKGSMETYWINSKKHEN